jgi:hypothetical protein
VSAKKPPAKIKEKTSHRTEAAATAKRKPALEAKESVQVMDARSHKDRRQDDRRQKELPVVAERRTTERRVKVTRRRQIDPTTCERDYSVEEVEFMSALDDYKRRSGRMFPTCSEILEVFRALGYQRLVKLPEATSTTSDLAVLAVTSEQTV